MVLDDLQVVLDQARAAGAEAFADPESIATLHRQQAQMEALVTEAVARFDADSRWEADGARSAASWLRSECRLSTRAAASRVRRGRHLRHRPETSEAFAKGDLTSDHVDVLVTLHKGATGEALLRFEKEIVGEGCRLRHDEFVRYVSYWRQAVDQDGTDDDAEMRRTRRDVYLVSSFDGMWFGQMTMDPVSGTIVKDELDRLEKMLFEVEWAEAKERLGREPTVTELARTPSQRRADALVEMATRSKATRRDGRRPAPLFTVLVDYDTLHGRICQLENGTVVPPGSLLQWLPDADIERARFAPDGHVEIGAPARLSSATGTSLARAVFSPVARVDIPSTRRLFTGSTRRAIEVRDRVCTHPTCDVPASHCQVDHIQPYSAGGPTTQENGRLLCGKHNRMRNQRPPPQLE